MFRRKPGPERGESVAGESAPPSAPPHDPERELNFARAILGDRAFREVPDGEVLREAERLLYAWMTNETRLERPKLYDHYALVLLALIRENRALAERVAALEKRPTPENGHG